MPNGGFSLEIEIMSGGKSPSDDGGGGDVGEGCELTQLGNTEVFFCKEHTGMNARGLRRGASKSGDAEIDDMVDSKMG